MTLAQPAEAKIVYTPAHVKINFVFRQYPLDLNHDGIKDFSFSFPGTSIGPKTEALMVRPVKGNNVVVRTDGSVHQRGFLNDLPAGALVGPKRQFRSYKEQVMVSWNTASGPTVVYDGNWLNVKNRYLGLAFVIKGKVHYGWARLNVSVSLGNIEGTLTGYAYETIPGKPIVAGRTKDSEENGVDEANLATLNESTLQPTSLGLLAMGSPGLAIWRREESVLTEPETK